MPQLPLNYWHFGNDTTSGWVRATRKSGDVTRGQKVRLVGVNGKGLFAVCFENGKPSEHWHKLETFENVTWDPANENAAQ